MQTARTVRWVAVLALAGAAALGGAAHAAPAVGTSVARAGAAAVVVEPDVDSDGLGDETQDADGGGLGGDTFDPDSLNFAWVGAWYADYDAGDALDPDV